MNLEILLAHEPVMAPISRAWRCSCGASSTPRRRGDDMAMVRLRRWREWCKHLDLALRGFKGARI